MSCWLSFNGCSSDRTTRQKFVAHSLLPSTVPQMFNNFRPSTASCWFSGSGGLQIRRGVRGSVMHVDDAALTKCVCSSPYRSPPAVHLSERPEQLERSPADASKNFLSEELLVLRHGALGDSLGSRLHLGLWVVFRHSGGGLGVVTICFRRHALFI